MAKLNTKEGNDMNLNNYDERMNTFQNWTSKLVKPEELAMDGFVYRGIDDLTACVYCGLEIDEWEEGDSPAKLHRESSPFCPAVTNMDEKNAKGGKIVMTYILSYCNYMFEMKTLSW